MSHKGWVRFILLVCGNNSHSDRKMQSFSPIPLTMWKYSYRVIKLRLTLDYIICRKRSYCKFYWAWVSMRPDYCPYSDACCCNGWRKRIWRVDLHSLILVTSVIKTQVQEKTKSLAQPSLWNWIIKSLLLADLNLNSAWRANSNNNKKR